MNLEIIDKLDNFIRLQKIPNIIFYGPNRSGKKYILEQFLKKLYSNYSNSTGSSLNASLSNELGKNIIYINCCHGKGNIKFIREELKFFAKSTAIYNNRCKSIILVNADFLTIDAQSSLRRLIEIYSNTTRFFIVVNDYNKLIKPIVSRFCSIYVNSNKLSSSMSYLSNNSSVYSIIYKVLHYKIKYTIPELVDKLYDKGITALDLLNYIKEDKLISDHNKAESKLSYHKVENGTNCKEDNDLTSDHKRNCKEDNDLTSDHKRNCKEDNDLTSDHKRNCKEDNDLTSDHKRNCKEYVKYKTLTIFDIIHKEFRDERILMFFIVNYLLFRNNYDIKNIIEI